MPTKLRKNIIRIGDQVRVLEPLRFIRCGYERNKETIRVEILEKHKLDIEQLLRATIGGVSTHLWNRATEKIADELAYAKLQMTAQSGARRRIYTELVESMRGGIYTVQHKTTAVTGQYFRYAPDYWTGEQDPPELSDVETHIILEIGYDFDFQPLKIEAKYVEKIQ